MARKLIPLADRFWIKVVRSGDDECWGWSGTTNKGYGRINVGGNMVLAHRVAWELTSGLIPPGMCVLHSCDNPPCVNPNHLFLGTHADNMRDMRAKGRHRYAVVRWGDHCTMGHELDDANTHTDKSGRRHCRQCRARYSRQFRERRRSRR